MIDITLKDNSELTKALDSIQGIDCIVNSSDFFIRVVMPEHTSDSYSISPKGVLWVSELHKGAVLVEPNHRPKPIPTNTNLIVKFMSLKEFEEANTEIISR